MSQPHTALAPLLVVLGAGSEHYSAHCLERIAAAHPTVLVDHTASARALDYVADFLSADLQAADQTAAAVKEYARRRPVAGVLTYLEQHVVLAASLAHDLGLPGMTPEAALRCRDETETRRLLFDHGVPSARSYTVDSEQDAVDYARLLGYPVVIKPRGLGGSTGVRRADSEAGVRAAYRAATSDRSLGLSAFAVTGCLVEEYLDGEEISAEAVVLGPRRTSIVAVTRKIIGPEPTFLEVGHSVRAHDALLLDPGLQSVVHRTVEALGITSGVLRIELRMTDRGPRVIGVSTCLGGDLIPLLVELALGIDLPAAAAALATAAEPDLTPRAASAAAVQFAFPLVSGRISELSVTNPDEPGLGTYEAWLERLVLTQRPGDYVSAPPLSSIGDRLAHWVVQGPDDRACSQRLIDVAERLVVGIDTPDYTTVCA